MVEIKSKTLYQKANIKDKSRDVEKFNLLKECPSKSISSNDPNCIEEILIEFDMAIKTGNVPSPALCSAIWNILQSKNSSAISFESEIKGSQVQVNKDLKVKNPDESLNTRRFAKSKRFVTHEELEQLSKLMPPHHDDQSIHQFNYLISQSEMKKRNVEFKNPIVEYETFKPVHYVDIHAPFDDFQRDNVTESQTMHNSCKVVGGLLKNDCDIKNMQSQPIQPRECISLSSNGSEEDTLCEWQDNYLII